MLKVMTTHAAASCSTHAENMQTRNLAAMSTVTQKPKYEKDPEIVECHTKLMATGDTTLTVLYEGDSDDTVAPWLLDSGRVSSVGVNLQPDIFQKVSKVEVTIAYKPEQGHICTATPNDADVTKTVKKAFTNSDGFSKNRLHSGPMLFKCMGEFPERVQQISKVALIFYPIAPMVGDTVAVKCGLRITNFKH